MSTHGLDTALGEMKTSHEQLSARKLALQVYLSQGVTDETKAWLQAQIAAHADRLALLDGVMSGLTALSETDFPELVMGEMPPDVQTNLDALDAQLDKTRETMATMRQHKSPPASEPAVEPCPPAEVPVAAVPEYESRRGRRGSDAGS